MNRPGQSFSARQYLLLFLAMMSACVVNACHAGVNERTFPAPLTGIDHLPAQYSIQQFSVDGTGGAQAGRGGRQVCCVSLPEKWHSGLTLKVQWDVTNWPKKIYSHQEQVVTVERYADDDLGNLYIHFLSDGSVRAICSMYAPWGDHYIGPSYKTVLKKQPWKDFEPAHGEPEFKLVPDATDKSP